MIRIEGTADRGSTPLTSTMQFMGVPWFRRSELEKGNLSSSRLLQQRKLINANSNEWYNLGEYSFEGNLEAGLAMA